MSGGKVTVGKAGGNHESLAVDEGSELVVDLFFSRGIRAFEKAETAVPRKGIYVGR